MITFSPWELAFLKDLKLSTKSGHIPSRALTKWGIQPFFKHQKNMPKKKA